MCFWHPVRKPDGSRHLTHPVQLLYLLFPVRLSLLPSEFQPLLQPRSAPVSQQARLLRSAPMFRSVPELLSLSVLPLPSVSRLLSEWLLSLIFSLLSTLLSLLNSRPALRWLHFLLPLQYQPFLLSPVQHQQLPSVLPDVLSAILLSSPDSSSPQFRLLLSHPNDFRLPFRHLV